MLLRRLSSANFGFPGPFQPALVLVGLLVVPLILTLQPHQFPMAVGNNQPAQVGPFELDFACRLLCSVGEGISEKSLHEEA